jgi:hypothetical protein
MDAPGGRDGVLGQVGWVRAVAGRGTTRRCAGVAPYAMRTNLLLAVVVVGIAAVSSGCGREARHQVRLSVEQIASISAEGALMADDLARGRTKTTYVRVHGNELSSQTEHEAEKLNDDPVTPDLRGRVQAAITLASDVGGAIDDLRTSPQDRRQARMVEHKLRHWADEAGKLAQSI